MSRNRGLVSCLLGIALISLLTALAYRVPSPRSDAAVETVPAAAFSALRAKQELQSLVGDGTAHPIGSAGGARVRTAIMQRLSALGYQSDLQSGFVCNAYAICGTPSNIVSRLPSRPPRTDAADESDLVLLAAHYDSVPAGPGACDDAAGVATVLEIARLLRSMPATRHPIALLITDGEEAGLLGAMLFVRDHPLAKHVAAAVNVEARGCSGPSLMFETGSANSWLMSLYRHAITRPITDSVYYDAYKSLPNGTDFTEFKAAGWQGFNFAFIGHVAYYHTPLDTVEHADLGTLQHQGDNALASLLALADSNDLRSQPAGDAVYFDVLSRLLIAWPAGYSLIASSATLGLLLIEAALLWRCRRVSGPQIAWGALGAVACVLLGGAAAGAILALLLEIGKVPPLSQYSWIAHPAWMNMTCATVAAGAAGASSHWLARRAGFWGFWLGTVCLLALLGVVVSVLRPGMGFIPLLTAATAVLAVMPSLSRRNTQPPKVAGRARPPVGSPQTKRMDIAALAPAWVMCALMIPVISMLYAALGSVAWILDALLLSLAATLLLPLLAAASSVLRRRCIVVATMMSIIGVLITIALPTYSAAWPQRLNFRYRLDASRQQAVWIAEADSLQLPDVVERSAPFNTELTPEYPDGHSRGFEAPAQLVDLAPPGMTLRATAKGAGGATRYDLHLQSLRGAPEIGVVFPSQARIHEIILRDASAERRVPLYESPSGMTHLIVAGLAPQGMDFAVEVHGTSLTAQVFDQSSGLPEGESLRRLRPPEATSSQEGDTTIVQNTVTLVPAAGR
jgi:hypothetical protein